MYGYLPILYECNETEFTDLGFGYCDCISCTVREVRNSLEEYQVTMVYPLSGVLAGEFKEGRLLLVLQDDTEEALSDRESFTIFNTVVDTDEGTITVYGMQEAVYRAKFYAMDYIPAVKQTAAARALSISAGSSTYKTGWYQEDDTVTVSTDIDGTYSFPACMPRSKLETLQGDENSMLDIIGGDLKPHRRNIALLKARGTDNGAIVRPGKNLASLIVDMSGADTYNAILPYWQSSNTDTKAIKVITGDESTGGQIIKCDTTEIPHMHCKVVDVSSMLNQPDDWDPETQGEWPGPEPWEVIAAGRTFITSGEINGQIKVTYTATVIPDYDAADPPMELCDTVLIQYPEAGINLQAKVTARTFNVLMRRHEEITIGSVTKSLTRSIRDVLRR